MGTTIIALSLLFSAFFAGMEIAYISSNRIKLEMEIQKNNWHSKILSFLMNRPKKYVATMLLLNNISVVVYGYFMGDLLVSFMEHYGHLKNEWTILIIQTLISTIFILVISEYLPKVVFNIFSNRLMVFFAFPAYVFYGLSYPFTFVIIFITDLLLKWTGNTDDAQEQIFIKDELKYILDEEISKSDEDIDSELKIFKNALEFSDLKVRDCFIPRKEMTAIELSQPIEAASKLFIETGYSKIIVYKEHIDQIMGYIHGFDLFKKPSSIEHILISVEWVSETQTLSSVMKQLTLKKKSLAMVADEYGGTAGLITMEDVVEKLFGKIDDEHDDEQVIEKQLSVNEYWFSARLDIDYLNKTYDLDLPEDDQYNTLAGFLAHLHEDLPEVGTILHHQRYKFEIKTISSTKIEEVLITKISED